MAVFELLELPGLIIRKIIVLNINLLVFSHCVPWWVHFRHLSLPWNQITLPLRRTDFFKRKVDSIIDKFSPDFVISRKIVFFRLAKPIFWSLLNKWVVETEQSYFQMLPPKRNTWGVANWQTSVLTRPFVMVTRREWTSCGRGRRWWRWRVKRWPQE